jgi:hypothetical protein
MAMMFPLVMFVLNAVQRGVIWFGGHRVDGGRHAGGGADRLPELPHPDPHVAVMMATMVVDHGAPRR